MKFALLEIDARTEPLLSSHVPLDSILLGMQLPVPTVLLVIIVPLLPPYSSVLMARFV